LLSACLLGGISGTARAADTFEIRKTDATGAVGAKSLASLTIHGKNGWHVNDEAPITIKLVAPPGVALAKPKLTKADAVEKTKDLARFDVALTAAEAGRKTVTAETSFVMCQETTCKPEKAKVELAIDATTAAAVSPARANAPVKKKSAGAQARKKAN